MVGINEDLETLILRQLCHRSCHLYLINVYFFLVRFIPVPGKEKKFYHTSEYQYLQKKILIVAPDPNYSPQLGGHLYSK